MTELPTLLAKSSLAVLSAVIIFTSSFLNLQPQQYQVLNHRETKNLIIFNVKTKEAPKDTPSQVTIDKNTGNIKINFRNKRDNVEFDLEYSGELTPEDRTNVDNIMKSILDYTKKNKTIKGKFKTIIKDFVNRKF